MVAPLPGLKGPCQILACAVFWRNEKYVLPSGEARLPARRQVVFFSAGAKSPTSASTEISPDPPARRQVVFFRRSPPGWRLLTKEIHYGPSGSGLIPASGGRVGFFFGGGQMKNQYLPLDGPWLAARRQVVFFSAGPAKSPSASTEIWPAK